MVKEKKITIKDVAREAEVSVAAVSKVIRNAYGVSDNLRHKVEEAIKKRQNHTQNRWIKNKKKKRRKEVSWKGK